MFIAASKALSTMVTPEEEERGLLLPNMESIRGVSARVALAVAREARDSGLGRMQSDEEYVALIARAQWEPRFYPYRPGVR
jgi:malic enzyme